MSDFMVIAMIARAFLFTALLLAATAAEARSSSSSPYGSGWVNPSSRGVSGYTKRDGTYVAPYRQTTPNSTTRDNYSAPGNRNPWKPGNK